MDKIDYLRRARQLTGEVQATLGHLSCFDSPPPELKSEARLGTQILVPKLWDDDPETQKQITFHLARTALLRLTMDVIAIGADATRGFYFHGFGTIGENSEQGVRETYGIGGLLMWRGETPVDKRHLGPQDVSVQNPELATREEKLRDLLTEGEDDGSEEEEEGS